MEEFDLNIVAKKSVKGVFALVSRTFLIQLLGIAASFILTVYLDPASYGVFFVVSSIIVFLNYFQDIGLAAALIQKKEDLTRGELTTTFTIQQVLVLTAVIPTLLFSPHIASFYKLDNAGYALLLSLIVSFFLSSLRTIPTVMLERKLDFNKLVVPQIVENFVYNALLIVCAVSGFGIASFTIAVLARSVIGLVATYAVQPWMPGLAFHKSTFKRLISFGLPFQTNSILALIKDDLFTIYIGKILPFNQVGYIGFGQKWAFLPLRLIMDNVIKITFPSMSRLQHDKEALKVAIEKSLFLISLCIFPAVIIAIMFSPSLIKLIPKYSKWEPALVSLTFFSLNAFMSSLSTPLTNFLNATGKIKISLYFMIFWTILTWVISPIFIFLYGFNGVSIASFIISLSSVMVFVVAKKYIEFSFIKSVWKQAVAAGVLMLFALWAREFISSFPTFIAIVFSSGMIYLVILFLMAKNDLIKTIKFIAISVKK